MTVINQDCTLRTIDNLTTFSEHKVIITEEPIDLNKESMAPVAVYNIPIGSTVQIPFDISKKYSIEGTTNSKTYNFVKIAMRIKKTGTDNNGDICKVEWF